MKPCSHTLSGVSACCLTGCVSTWWITPAPPQEPARKPHAKVGPPQKPHAKAGLAQTPQPAVALVPFKRPAISSGAEVRRMMQRGAEIYQVRCDGKAVVQCTSRAAGSSAQASEVAEKLAAAASRTGATKAELAYLKDTLLAEVRAGTAS